MKNCLKNLFSTDRDIEYTNVIAWFGVDDSFMNNFPWALKTDSNIYKAHDKIRGACDELNSEEGEKYYFHDYRNCCYTPFQEDDSKCKFVFLL